METSRPFLSEILGEVEQAPGVRQRLIAELEGMLEQRTVVCFYTSFAFPVRIQDRDADMLEAVLHGRSLEKGLTLVIDSPGGDPLAAERIISVCRSYTGGDFEVVVPRRAKSAATMVCLGASKIWMGETSELGPIDPQVIVQAGESLSVHSAYEMIESYKRLVRQATRAKGRIEPYLQQLAAYNAADIEAYEREQALAESIALEALRTGMMKGSTEKAIRRRIRPFLDPRVRLAHRRRIGPDMAQKAGLCVARMDIQGHLWNKVLELHERATYVVSTKFMKLVESRDHSFTVSAPAQGA